MARGGCPHAPFLFLSLSAFPDEKGPRNSLHQQRSMMRRSANRAAVAVLPAHRAWKNRMLVIQWKVRSFPFSLDRAAISMKSFFSVCGKQRITIIRPLLMRNSPETSLLCFRATGVKRGDLFSLADLCVFCTRADSYTNKCVDTRRLPDDPSMIWMNAGSEKAIARH